MRVLQVPITRDRIVHYYLHRKDTTKKKGEKDEGASFLSRVILLQKEEERAREDSHKQTHKRSRKETNKRKGGKNKEITIISVIYDTLIFLLVPSCFILGLSYFIQG